jgi:hypothetical protein
MEAAIRDWIEIKRSADNEPLVSAATRWNRMLGQILASGDTEAIRAVQQNLRVIYRAIGGESELHLERQPEVRRQPDRSKKA